MQEINTNKVDFTQLRKYDECVGCNRRMFVQLFVGLDGIVHTTCANCREVTAEGVPIPKYTKEKEE